MACRRIQLLRGEDNTVVMVRHSGKGLLNTEYLRGKQDDWKKNAKTGKSDDFCYLKRGVKYPEG